MNNTIELLRLEIGKSVRDAEQARLLVAELVKTDWELYLRKNDAISNMEQRLAALESQLAEKKIIAQPAKVTKQVSQPISTAEPLPPGSMKAKDFYEKHSVSLPRLRYHTEKGFPDGDTLETTDLIPHPTRPDYRIRWLTPSQQQATFEFWDRHGVKYIIPEESEEAKQNGNDGTLPNSDTMQDRPEE